MRLGPHTVTVVRAGPPADDAFGNPIPGWGSATEATVSGCSVQPLVGTEVILGRDTTVSRWQVWAPSSADVKSTDRVVFDGDTYEVDGQVQAWLFGVGHITFLMRRSESA